ncbi:subtilisin-like protein [Lindgomyces ingoldianus]|uniref:Subtilisin-like protein n=1 Tax=Lindgomyces ingoldianus TaxID=673940 RepID=A0ACB6R0P9_9PLEO|nr:subtilisin-like protein [Lindgomyces ingoldianus]KAF2472756.1 subtilisin-like protein [Lindgomyces ingoldianus]
MSELHLHLEPSPSEYFPPLPNRTISFDTVSERDERAAAQSNTSPSKKSNPSSWRQRRAERLARRENTFKLKTMYAALTKDPGNQDGIKEAQDWIEKRLEHLGKDPKFAIVLRGPEDNEVIGWGALELNEQSSIELGGLSNIQSVVVDEAPKKRLIATKRDRAFNWDQLAWKKVDAPFDLIDVGRCKGKKLDELEEFTYESQRGKRNDGKRIYIYIIEEGIQMDVKYRNIPEFPNREQTIYTDHCIIEGHNNENDEDLEFHGTIVASLALGQSHGVSKSATLVSVKYWGPLTDMIDALYKAGIHIRDNGRQLNSIIVLTNGPRDPTDPVKAREIDPAAADTYKWISTLHDAGVPVIAPAGNDRLLKNGNPSREAIDFWPSNWESPNFPLINVAEMDLDGIRSEESQAGNQVTTWASSKAAWVMRKDGTSDEGAGTSLGCGIVAGVIAGLMALDEPPWGAVTGRDRVEAIRQFIRNGDNSGWKRDDKQYGQGNTLIGERII